MKNRIIILGSGSPRRQEMLRQTGFDVKVVSPEIDEPKREPLEIPSDYALRLARLKMQYVQSALLKGKGDFGSFESDIKILTFDTIVVLEDMILGKPANENDAFNMLSLLSERWHDVYTGWTIKTIEGIFIAEDIEKTSVEFRTLTEEEILNYIKRSTPFDKAGSYGIQDDGFNFARKIVGLFSNVVGLPIEKILPILER